MSHELYQNEAGKTSMAYVGEEPWHGLGQKLTPNSPIEVWTEEAGMNYELVAGPAQTTTPSGPVEIPNRRILFRSDSHVPLSVVSDRYRVVQPKQVLEFFRDLASSAQFSLETAGVLYNGSTYWALAKTNYESKIMGDIIRGYLLLSSSCDGSMSTRARFVSTRVVCNNTLQIAMDETVPEVRVTHRSMFDDSKVKQKLGLTDEVWAAHEKQVRDLAHREVTLDQVNTYLVALFGNLEKPVEEQLNGMTISRVRRLYLGDGIGSDMKSAEGTAWGALNAVTEYLDHHKGRNQDARLSDAWFYGGNTLKQRAFELAVEAL